MVYQYIVHGMRGPTAKQLEVFERIPSGRAVDVSDLRGDRSRSTLLFHLRNLEELGLVRTVDERPKSVEVGANPFATSLHGIVRSRPHLREVVRGSFMLVLAGLATGGGPMTGTELSETTGLHRNTLRGKLGSLRRRALVERTKDGYRLAEHAPELRYLGHAFRDHVLEEFLKTHRSVYPVLTDGLRVLLEADGPVEDLDATAAFRFQLEGADVLAARPQYVFTPARGPVDLPAAYRDARRLPTPPRTLAAMERFLRGRGEQAG